MTNAEQMRITPDNRIMSDFDYKMEIAINRYKAFEPPEGYFLAFSGGKDSQAIYHLAKIAGVKFDAHCAMTSVDPPELIRFRRKFYPDVIEDVQHYSDGKPEHYYPDGRPKPITMWSLIADHTVPPTRKARYCCAALKEVGGKGRLVVTGVRWEESANRRNTHGAVDIQGRPKSTKKLADEMGAEYKLNKHDEIIMNDDNDENRRMVEHCYRTQKTLLNPIVDWTDEDVWHFLNDVVNVPHCELYDEGFTRLGCIGCPLAGSKYMIRDFERWPRYKDNYIRAFEHMIERHPGQIKVLDPNAKTKFKLFDEAENGEGGMHGFGIGSNGADDADPGIVSRNSQGGDNTAKAMLERWIKVALC